MLDSMSGEAGAFAADAADGGACGVCCGGGLSFAPSTLVATPSGEQAIGSLAVGDTVLAYNPATGKREPEPVQRLWRNHDHDLVDVHLTTTTTPPSDADPSVRQSGTASATSRLHRWVRQGAWAAGLAATLLTTTSGGATAQAHTAAATTSTASSVSTSETIHTTANHPWLTADRGWVHAGDLRPGESVVTLPDATGVPASAATTTATVAWVRGVSGAAEMDNLTVAQDHTYAVGTSRAVVHNLNCDDPYQSAPSGPNIVYRALAPGEDTADGLTARAPDALEVTPASHVAGKRLSPWISTTRSLRIAIEDFGGVEKGVVAVDLSQVPSPIVDLSSGIPGREGQMISNWAAKKQEVLIFQRAPSQAVVWRWKP